MDDAAGLRRLEGLFDRAADLSADGRRELLEPLRRAEPELVADVERLLERADRGRDLSAVGPLLPTSAARSAGRVGPYRLVECIGRGGMGEVHRAERADGQYAQTVAVKLNRSGFVTPELGERFRFERQILARLEHPNISRLLDGSATEGGAPYLVMEYVEGRPIDEYCDGERASIERRLDLFRTVCRAVAHAHRNLVVHRDLKPSNILVTAEGEVKLLDFGIAKLLAPDGEAGGDLTRTLAPLMTPGYASPEQVRGEPVTTATDVYALGLLLYQLLCGRRAQRPEDSSFAALERVVCLQEPPRPSDALGSGEAEEVEERLATRGATRLARLRHRLRGDLDTIVAAALRKEPARRYASAQQLLEDVDRHLEGRPVVARPDTLGYRTGKFLRRHRLAVAASAAIALSLVVGLVLALAGLVRAQRAERRAIEEAATSGQISEFLVDLFRANDPGEAMGETVTAHQLLDRGRERIEQRLGNQPAVRARLLGTMSQAYESLGLFEPALELAERRLDAERERLGERSAEAGRALVELSDVHRRQGDYVGARGLALQALEVLEDSARSPSGATQDDLAAALNNLGGAYSELGELEQAGAVLERALAIREREPEPKRSLRPALNSLAIVRWRQGDVEQARSLFGRALAIAEEEFGADHPEVAHIANNLALAHRDAGDVAQAIAAHERALAIREKVLAPDHPDIAESLSNLGDLLRQHDDPRRAREMLERALEIRERTLGPDHNYVAYTLNNLALSHLDLGEPAAARPLFERALDILERALGPDHMVLSYPITGLARVAEAEGDLKGAERGFQRALAIRQAQLGESHPLVAGALADYATFLRNRGRDAEAEALEARAEQVRSPAS